MAKYEFTDSSADPIEFIGFSDDASVLTKPDIMGQRLWGKLFERNIEFGGMSAGLYGVPGSGKTSLMLLAVKKISKMHPDECIIWREPHNIAVQILNIGLPVNFLSEDKLNLEMRELTMAGYEKKSDAPVVRHFQTVGQCMKMLQPGVNCVYFDDRTGWVRLIKRLKANLSWYSLLIDEAEDLFGSRVSGKEWHLNEQFCSEAKELRKARISLWLNSQTDWDVDSRIRSKLISELYLYGSKKQEDCPLYRGCVQNIQLGEAWIVFARSLFGKIHFPPVAPLGVQYIAVPTPRKHRCR